MLKEHWDELLAQVESHGPNAIKLYLADSGNGPDDDLELTIEDIRFNNSNIEVRVR